MTIHCDHQQTTRVSRVTVSGDTEEERTWSEERWRAKGYVRKYWEIFDGEAWVCVFVRTEEVEE